MVSRLVYIANSRLPTEKAHGYQICQMCKALAENDVEVLLLHPYRHQADPLLRSHNVFDYYSIRPIFQVRPLPNLDAVRLERFVPSRIFPLMFLAHALLWGSYAARVARKAKADIYYTRDTSVAFSLVRLGLPTVLEIHVVPMRGQRWLLERIAHHQALRLVVVLTSFLKERLVAMGFPSSKVTVLPSGVDLSVFEGLPGKDECRRRLGLPLERAIIGYIGRFQTMEVEKGIPELVQAMGSLSSVNGLDPFLLSVGGPMDAVPPYIEIAQRFGVSAQKFRFVDRVPNKDVPYWIRACDVVTIPFPWTEHFAYYGSPLKLFEYMASGVPIVATDLPSIREVLTHGKNAWLVKPGDPKALADGIRRVLTDAALSGNLAAQAQLESRNHTWERRASEILNHIK